MNKIKQFTKKYVYLFHVNVGMEVWRTLPFRAKVGLIVADVLIWSFIAICAIILIRRYFFGGTGIHIYWN